MLAPTDDGAAAEAVLLAWRARQDLWIAPGAPIAAVAVPEAVLAEVGLPDSYFDRVCAIFENQLRRAIADTIAEARKLA